MPPHSSPSKLAIQDILFFSRARARGGRGPNNSHATTASRWSDMLPKRVVNPTVCVDTNKRITCALFAHENSSSLVLSPRAHEKSVCVCQNALTSSPQPTQTPLLAVKRPPPAHIALSQSCLRKPVPRSGTASSSSLTTHSSRSCSLPPSSRSSSP